ncbi:MAG: shikimate kinase [Candidatus Syntrophopropionicum ammoniitolerans]
MILGFLEENGIIIALTASPDVIFQRVKGKKQRPLLAKGDLRENINKLLQERWDIYQKADLIVDTGIRILDESVGQIVSFINGRLSP